MNNLKNHFDLSKNNNVQDELIKFSSQNNLKLSDEYLYIMEHINFDHDINIYYNLDIDDGNLNLHHCYFGRFYEPFSIISSYRPFIEIDIQYKSDMPGIFKTFDADQYLNIGDVASLSYINNYLYMNCGETDNGSLYFIDYFIDFEDVLEATGVPLKIKIADSFEHLIEISKKQAHMRPVDFI